MAIVTCSFTPEITQYNEKKNVEIIYRKLQFSLYFYKYRCKITLQEENKIKESRNFKHINPKVSLACATRTTLLSHSIFFKTPTYTLAHARGVPTPFIAAAKSRARAPLKSARERESRSL